MALRTGMPMMRLALLRGFALSDGGRTLDPATERRTAGDVPGAERRAPAARLCRRIVVAGVGRAQRRRQPADGGLADPAGRWSGDSTPPGSRLHLAEVVAVDVLEATAVALSVDSRAEPDAGAELLDLLDSELLPDWYDDWLPPYRERWRQTRLHSLESLALRMARAGRFAVAVDAALAAVRAEPLRESANRCLIQVHLAEGNVYEARRVLELHRQAIRADLGIEPSPQLVALVSGSRHNGALTMR